MANSGGRSIGQEVNAWVQTVGILIAAAWGVYTFVYKEMIEPKSAPINISVDLELKKVGAADVTKRGTKKRLIPVELRVSAKNPSSREVFLLSSAWIAWGIKVTAISEPAAFDETVRITLEKENALEQRHAEESGVVVVAWGGLLEDTSLKPNEVATRSLIFYVPANEYDSIEVQALMPTVARAATVELEWEFDDKAGELKSTMYRLSPGGERKEMKPGKRGGYSDAKLELQEAVSRATLSLWQ